MSVFAQGFTFITFKKNAYTILFSTFKFYLQTLPTLR